MDHARLGVRHRMFYEYLQSRIAEQLLIKMLSWLRALRKLPEAGGLFWDEKQCTKMHSIENDLYF